MLGSPMVQPPALQQPAVGWPLVNGAAAPPEYDIELRNIFKMFGGQAAVRDVDFQVQKGELFSILGPSGCGKTTLLRIIAGFEEPSAGEIRIAGYSMVGVPPHRRPINTVFQSYALFGHMNVRDNVAFGLKVRGVPAAEVQERVKNALKLVRLEKLGDRHPKQLSGGQQQRVALARALVNRPRVVLLDEPLGALDLKLRKQMQVELSNLQHDLGITFVMVTHDQEEALSISDRVAVMNQGQIEQIGLPSEIYNHPATPFVADFVGDTNLFECQILDQDGAYLELKSLTGLAIVAIKPESWQKDTAAIVSVRPEKIYVSSEPIAQPFNIYRGTVNNILYMGNHYHLIVDLNTGNDRPAVRIRAMRLQQHGELPRFASTVYVHWSPDECVALARPAV